MSTFEKRAREDKRDERRREKDHRRRERRFNQPKEPEIVSASDIQGALPSIEEVMQGLQGGGVQRSAAPIPAKLFVGSLSDLTTSARLRAHFETQGPILEAAVITDRATGMSRNFGFVTMADRKDAARAITALHGSELDGRNIVVNVSTER